VSYEEATPRISNAAPAAMRGNPIHAFLRREAVQDFGVSSLPRPKVAVENDDAARERQHDAGD
jgi:hypothetical protein